MRNKLYSRICAAQVVFILTFIMTAGHVFSQGNQENLADANPKAGTADTVNAEQDIAADKLSVSKNITLDFKDAEIQSVLRIISYKSGVNIVTTPDIIGNVTIRLVDVPWEQALETITKTCGFGFERLSDKIIMVSTLERLAQQRKSLQEAAAIEPLDTQSFVLNFSKAEDVKNSVEKLISPKGKITVESRSNTIIITDIKSNLKLVGDIIKSVDKATPQVMIEARIIETTLGTAEKLGINWTTQVTAAGAKRPTTIPFKRSSDANMFPDVKRQESYSYEPATTTSAAKEVISVTSDFPLIPGLPTTFAEFRNLGYGSFPMSAASDFSFGTLDFSGFKAVLEVLSSRSDTKILSNPRITTLNNQEAKMLVGTIVPIPIYAYSKESGTQTITGYESLEIGIKLIVTPNINERNYITLSIKPSVDEITAWTGPNNERPIVSTRSAETKVMIRDGQTLAMGGLISEKKIKSRRGIPILKDIPIICFLFSKKEDTIDRTELLIFITPRIVKDDVMSSEDVARLEESLGKIKPGKKEAKAKKRNK